MPERRHSYRENGMKKGQTTVVYKKEKGRAAVFYAFRGSPLDFDSLTLRGRPEFPASHVFPKTDETGLAKRSSTSV
jgi:hypothetical protein